MENRPVIGVLPLVDDARESLWMLPGYLDGIREAGGLPVMLPLTREPSEVQQLFSLCDGFLFTGGHDVSPELYGETSLGESVERCPVRDSMELQLLSILLADRKPALGICRGIQLMNAALGGSLYQDLPTQYDSETDRHQTPPYDVPQHRVTVLPGTPLRMCLQQKELAVNSYHHQAIRTLAPSLRPMARSEDGLIEAVYAPDHPFLWGVQWHPEFSFRTDPASRAIFSEFVSACNKSDSTGCVLPL